MTGKILPYISPPPPFCWNSLREVDLTKVVHLIVPVDRRRWVLRAAVLDQIDFDGPDISRMMVHGDEPRRRRRRQ